MLLRTGLLPAPADANAAQGAERKPDMGELRLQLADMNLLSGAWSLALNELDRIPSDHPAKTSDTAHYVKFEALAAMGRIDEAKDALRATLNKNK